VPFRPPRPLAQARRALSRLVGWLADRRVPTALRAPLFSLFARATGADLSDTRGPLEAYASLSAFFVRRLVEGARPVSADPRVVVSPVDGTVQAADAIEGGRLLQAKGRAYALAELCAGVGAELDWEGGFAWTIYLGPRDYHRIHAPEACRVGDVRWVDGERLSVAPAVLARRPVLATNERCVLRLESERGPLVMVLVGALNVGRIRVLGVPPGRDGAPPGPLSFARGEELARFELGSTVVLLAPRGGPRGTPLVAPGRTLRLGEPIGRWW